MLRAFRNLPLVALVLTSILILIAHTRAPAQLTAPEPDPCAIAGTYEMDRGEAHALIIADADSSLAALGSHQPEDMTGTEVIVWEAERDAHRQLRQRAVDSQIVPRVTARLDPDGTFTHEKYTVEGDEVIDVQVGRWKIDEGCRTFEIDVNDHQTTGEVVGERIVLELDAPAGLKSLEYVRLR